jgi:glycosyltransferase involved in cell wall biosynthesis
MEGWLSRVNATIAICTWNRCESLRVTLETMTKLRVPAGISWELVVVNNNCTDQTDAVCASFEGRLPIRVLHEPTPGQARARNLAIREGKGQRILWTDDDVLVDEHWMASLLAAFDAHQAEWVFGPSEPEWPGRQPDWYVPEFRNYFAVLDYGDKPFVVTSIDTPFFGLNFGGTKTAHEKLGGFRADFGFKGNLGGVGEDIDVFQRALASSMRIVYTPDARVRHVIPEARVGKHYHRRRQWVATDVYYQHLPELFPRASFLLGLPRFLYSKAARDAVGYLQGVVTFDASRRFRHEIQLVRFAGLSLAAARAGFKKARPQST